MQINKTKIQKILETIEKGAKVAIAAGSTVLEVVTIIKNKIK